MDKKTATTDYFVTEVIHRAIEAIGQEMFTILQKTAHSPLIFETLDCAVGATDARGELVCMGNGVTGFMGTLDIAVKSVIEKYGAAGQIGPGDIFMLNDPFAGGASHLSDMTLVMPVFYEDEMVAFVVNKAHWSEVGGMEPGSVSSNTTDIFQEGLQVPNIKLARGGEIQQVVLELIAANVRLPEMSLGDLWAGIAALRMGAQRFLGLFEKHGRDGVIEAMARLLDYGEEMVRQALRELPNGTFEAEDWLDTDGLGGGPFPIRVKVTISDDAFVCDYSGSHPQVAGSINCTVANLASRTRAVFRAVTVPHLPTNGGMYRPLEVICPPGTVFSAQRPAPVSTYFESSVMAMDLVWKALAPHVPHRLTAGNFGSICAITVSGHDPQTGEMWILFGPYVGGWGAGNDHDGGRGQFSAANGETFNVPIEIAETRYGLVVQRYGFHTEPAGHGKFRGGNGAICEYRVTAEQALLSTGMGRHKFPPWGVNGGHNGSCNYVTVIRADGSEEIYGKAARIRLYKGDVIRHVTATAGGWGDPADRDRQHVLDDLRDGYITPEVAREIYGVTTGDDVRVAE